MWEWFTTKPFVDAGQARFVRRRDVSRSSLQSHPKLPPRMGNRAPDAGLDVATG